MERILDYFNIHTLWQALILLVIALFLTGLILKGKAIFYPSFYRSHRIGEITEIEVPTDIAEKIREKPIPEGKVSRHG